MIEENKSLRKTGRKQTADISHCTLGLLVFAFFWLTSVVFQATLIEVLQTSSFSKPFDLVRNDCTSFYVFLHTTYAQMLSLAADLFCLSTIEACAGCWHEPRVTGLQRGSGQVFTNTLPKTAFSKHHKSLLHGEPAFASASKSVILCFPCKNMHASCRSWHVWFFLVQHCEGHY